MTLTAEQLQAIMPGAPASRVAAFLPHINATLAEFGIDTPRRAAAFLANLGHESLDLRFTREIGSGSAYDTGKLAERLGNTPEDDDDGERFKGRGLIQITGTDNYRAYGEYAGFDALAEPELLEGHEHASRSAGWFWTTRKLNVLADANDFERICKRINGGLNGYDDRVRRWGVARTALGAM